MVDLKDILISKEDEHMLTEFKWRIGGDGYVLGHINKKSVPMHRYIIIVKMGNDIPSDIYVDHINNCKHDNRRENLRIATSSENSCNRGKMPNASSKFYGVEFIPRDDLKAPFRARLRINGKFNFNAHYEREIDAAWQYNLWIKENDIKFLKINDIEEPTEFVRYEKKIRNLPKNIYMRYEKYHVQYKSKYIGTFTTLDEAELMLQNTKDEIEKQRIKDILSQPIIRNDEGIAMIKIKDKEILIDDDKYYTLLIHGRVSLLRNKYARIIDDDGKFLGLHRYLLNYNGPDVVDHKNRNGLDNRLCNLRIATRTQNAQNVIKDKTNATSKYMGVSYDKLIDKWRATIRIEGEYTHIGYYKTEEEAARARDKSTKQHHGEFGIYNFEENLISQDFHEQLFVSQGQKVAS